MDWRASLQSLAGRFGYVITRKQGGLDNVDPGFDEAAAGLHQYSMTSRERMHALYQGTCAVERNRVPGAIVECGVWRGGSMMLVCRTLLRLGAPSRPLYLYDTYAGMTEPSAADRDRQGRPARELLAAAPRTADSLWCIASLEDVRRNLLGTGYPEGLCNFVVGPVEQTLPATAPEQIALLRLDTDWYESTRHELTHLFPRLADGAIVIADDYGFWRGTRQAIDEYLAAHDPGLLLHRVDDAGRIGVVRRERR